MYQDAPPVTVNAVALYERIGPSTYNDVTAMYRWAGPADMARVLAPVNMNGAVVADFGIGTGALSNIFRRANASRIIGIDGAQSYLSYCLNNRLADEIVHADLAHDFVNLPDSSVDVVTGSGLFSYLENPQGVVWEMKRIAKPGAVIAVNFHGSQHHYETEKLPATSVHPRGAVRFHRYGVGVITEMFRDVGIRLEHEITNPQGLIRATNNKFLPLTTQRYRT